MGVRVRIMLPHDPTGAEGVKKPLSDVVEILTPKDPNSVLPVPAVSKLIPHAAPAPVQQQQAAPAAAPAGGFGGYSGAY
jgi:small subunit ribosomal protein S3e